MAAAFSGLCLPEFFGDFAVQTVNVRQLQPSAELDKPLLHSFDLALPERFLAGFIGQQGLFEPARISSGMWIACKTRLYLDSPQNAKGMFRPEHCVWFSVLPR